MEGLSSKLSRVGGTGSGAALLRAPVPLQLLSRGPGGAWAVSTVPPSVLGPREPLHPSKGTVFPHFLLPVAREKMSPPPDALRLYFPPGPRRSSEIPDSLSAPSPGCALSWELPVSPCPWAWINNIDR